ncbi:MAG: metallophosphatase family protein [Treponema sp.]|nr:metallophosphatase family protein [Treponema sp.]
MKDIFAHVSTNTETDSSKLLPFNQFSSFFLSIFLAFTEGDYQTQTFAMPDKKSIHANKEVASFYPWMYTSDIMNPFSANGVAFFSADIGNSLNSAAYNLCDLDKHNIVVFGHTHEPLLEKRSEGQRIYANTGYLCPAIPDVQQKGALFSFVEIQKDGAAYTVRCTVMTTTR